MTIYEANLAIAKAAGDYMIVCPCCDLEGKGRLCKACNAELELILPDFSSNLQRLLSTLQKLGIELVDLSITDKVAVGAVRRRGAGPVTFMAHDIDKLSERLMLAVAEVLP